MSTHLGDEQSLELGCQVRRVDSLHQTLQTEFIVRRRRGWGLAGRGERRALRLVLVELHREDDTWHDHTTSHDGLRQSNVAAILRTTEPRSWLRPPPVNHLASSSTQQQTVSRAKV